MVALCHATSYFVPSGMYVIGEEKMTSKREALIEAAKELLWERGFEAMSPKAVLAASGAGQGSLYHHFSGKRDLAATALEDVAGELWAQFDAIFGARRSAIKRLMAYLDMPREALRGCRFGRLANERSIADPVINPIVQKFFTDLETRLALSVRAAQKAGDLPSSLNAKDTAMMLNAIVQGGYVLSRVHQDPMPLKQAVRAAKAMLRTISSMP